MLSQLADPKRAQPVPTCNDVPDQQLQSQPADRPVAQSFQAQASLGQQAQESVYKLGTMLKAGLNSLALQPENENALGSKEHTLSCHNCQPGNAVAAHHRPPRRQETVFTT